MGKIINMLVEINQYECTHQNLHVMCLSKKLRVIKTAYWIGCLKLGLNDGSNEGEMQGTPRYLVRGWEQRSDLSSDFTLFHFNF